MDHPIWLKNQLQHLPDNYVVLTHDAHYQDFIEQFYPEVLGSMLFPPAFAKDVADEDQPTFAERQYDVTFIGTYGDYRKKIKQILECQPPVRHLAAHYLKKMKEHTDLTAETAFAQVLEERGMICEKEEFLDLFFGMNPVIQCVMYYYREKVIRTLLDARIPVHIFGTTWKESRLAEHPLLTIHEDVTPEESLSVMRDSKISLNIMAWHKGGFTERMANCMEQGSVLLTDQTTYDDGELKDKKNICMFHLGHLEALPDQIQELLSHEEKWNEISAAARVYVANTQSGKVRVQQLIDLIDQMGGYV